MVGLRKILDTPAPRTTAAIESAKPAPAPAAELGEVEPVGAHKADTVERPVDGGKVDPGAEHPADDGVAATARGQVKGRPLDRARGLFAQVDKQLERDANFKNLPTDDQDAIKKLMKSFDGDAGAQSNLKNLATRPGFIGDIKVFRSPGFARLDLKTQKDVVRRLQDFDTHPQKAHNLVDLITSPEFDKLSTKSIKRLVDAQFKHPNDATIAATFRDLAGVSGFSTLGEPGRTRAVAHLVRNRSDSTRVDNLKNMVRATDFVSTEASLWMLNGVLARPDDAQLVADFTRVSDRSDFRALDPNRQIDVLDRIENWGAGGAVNADNVLNVFVEPQFDKVWGTAREEVLNALTNAYADTRLDPTNMANLMTLAAEPAFAKLDAKVQRRMIETLAARPDNTALATALRDLAKDGAFRAEHTNKWKKIDEVDRNTP